MNTTILAGIVKRVYPKFDMGFFNDRLKLQKLIYLMQASSLNLGYNFRLYLHGPYCSLLAREGFDMPKLESSKTAYFEEKENEEKFSKVLNFLKEFKDDPVKMEILASLHLFKKIYSENSDKKLVELVRKKDIKFNDKEKLIEDLLNRLNKFGIMS